MQKIRPYLALKSCNLKLSFLLVYVWLGIPDYGQKGPKHVVEIMLNNLISKSCDRQFIYLYRRTVHFVVYLSNTPTNAHI